MGRRPDHVTDLICLIAVAVLYAAILAANLFTSDLPTFSESEKRELAAFPSFSVASVADGSFFSGLSDYISDNFVGRDRMVRFSKRIESLTGLQSDLIVLKQENKSGEDADDVSSLLAQLTTAALPAATTSAPSAETTVPSALPAETEPPFPPETTAVSDSATPPETETEPPAETEPEPPADTEPEPPLYLKLTLSRYRITLLKGSSAKITATVDMSRDEEPEPCLWTLEDPDVAELRTTTSGINVVAKNVGQTALTCTLGGLSQTCTVIVTGLDTKQNDTKDYDFLTSGMFIWGDAAYLTAGYSEYGAESFLQVMQYYRQLFPETRVSVMPIPVSSIVVDDPRLITRLTDQADSLARMNALYEGSGVRFVNVADTFLEHRSEYLYLKTDHHWTALGAYYAYTVFAESVGLTPAPLTEFTRKVLRSEYHGSLTTLTQDERLLAFSDVLEAYVPNVPCTMTITRTDGSALTYTSTIVPSHSNYLSFIGGDNPFTIINCPDNPQDLSILVLKDSYGDAFVPYLTLHYGNIIVIDPRYCEADLSEQFADYGLDDILFINNTQSVNTSAWIRLYLALVGIE